MSNSDWGRYYYSDNYINDLKSVAIYQGYTPEEIDTMLDDGFTVDEIEEYIYCMNGEL